MAVTLRDIAREVNLSHATVSFVLNDRRDVAIPEATRARVTEAAQRLGYRPNRAARALALGRTQMIALWLPSTYNTFYAMALHHVQEAMRGSEYEAIVCQARFGDADSREPRPLDWPVDGVLAIDCALAGYDLLGAGGFDSSPVVHAGVYVDRNRDYVAVDLQDGVRQAMDHLADAGCKRTAFVTVSNPLDQDEPRKAAYCASLEKTNGSPEIIECPSGTPSAVRETVAAHIRTHGCPDAILCYNDHVAMATNRAVRDLGMSAPKDVALVGCDGLEMAEYVEPSLTTIAQPVDEMCRLGWEFLQNRIKDPTLPPQHAILKPRLLVRESTSR